MNLVKASHELFRRKPDERFESLDSLISHCESRREGARELWQPNNTVSVVTNEGSQSLQLQVESEQFQLNDWSFSQLCKLHGVDKDTVNRVSKNTAASIFRDTAPSMRKPLQVYTAGSVVHAVHGTGYSRLFDAELLNVVRESAPKFHRPPKGFNGATGLYAGEQDCFAFLIDPDGWVNINNEVFAPGFFVWNSEVGRRSVGIQTFWYQRICANHIVWDAVEVFELKRKHAGNVQLILDEIRGAIDSLVKRSDERRDSFAKSIQTAMQVSLGKDAEEVSKVLRRHGISHKLVEQALKLIPEENDYSVFSAVDALTRIAGRYENAGDRSVLDQKAASLLTLAV